MLFMRSSLRIGIASSRTVLHHYRCPKSMNAIGSSSNSGVSTTTASAAAAAAAMDGTATGPPAADVRVEYLEPPAGTGGGRLARIVLQREKALNALDAPAVEALRQALLDAASAAAAAAPSSSASAAVAAVVLDSSTPRAFCAGGDVKAARAAALEAPYAGAPPDGHLVHRVFQAEYSTVILQAGLARALPTIALCDGVWMGLGFGISGFARHRVVTERTLFAMPENTIGLWPDVGFAYAAARLASPAAALFAALTGARIAGPDDLLWLGLATHACPSDELLALRAALAADPSGVESTLDRACHTAPKAAGPLQRAAPAIERALYPLLYEDGYGAGGDEAAALDAAVARLEQEAGAATGDAEVAALLQAGLAALASTSPASQATTLGHFVAVARAAAAAAAAAPSSNGSGSGAGSTPSVPPLATLRGVMQAEYRMAVRRVGEADFLEGVRALLVDKDRAPKWRPAGRGAVPPGEAARLAAPLPEGCCAGGLDLAEVDAALARLGVASGDDGGGGL